MAETWTRLPDAPVGRKLGPDGPLQCTHRARHGDNEVADRCGGVLGHEPMTWGDLLHWAHEPAVAGHDPWPEVGRLYEEVGGHIWYCDRGPLSLCGRCGLPYSRWGGDECDALGPVHGPELPSIGDYRSMERAPCGRRRRRERSDPPK